MEAEPPALTVYPQAQRLLGGPIWHVPDSPPEWVLGLDTGQFKAYGVVSFP